VCLDLWSLLIFIFKSCFKKVDWCWKRVKSFMLIVVQIRACLDSGVDFCMSCLMLFWLCLVVIIVAWLVSNDWECLMCLWKNHALFLLYGSILLWYSPLMLYLGWLGACSHHVWLQTIRLKPLWSFGFWLVISLYALVNNVLSLCMIMAVIALFVGRSQSFASLHLYW
jgi:hypothetical protein